MKKHLKLCALSALVIGCTTASYADSISNMNRKCSPENKTTRMLQAFQIMQSSASKIHRALDLVMRSEPNDSDFEKGVGYVLGVQYDKKNMDINIDGKPAANEGEFRENWANATKNVKYRKRDEVDWILGEYSEDENCLRTITGYSVGQNFNVIYTTADHSATGPVAVNYATDKFKVTLKEVPEEVGNGCNFNFRIVKIEQITEARLPLPNQLPGPNGTLITPVLTYSPTAEFDDFTRCDQQ